MNKQVRIDNRLDSYRSFFDSEWAESIDLLAEKTRFEEVTFDLVAAWKGAAIVREFPWLMMYGIKGALEAEVPTRDPLSLRIIRGLEGRLAVGAGPLPLSPEHRGRLRQTLLLIREECHEILRKNPTVVDIEKHWKEFVSIPDFTFRLWKSERNAYGAVYYAYEDFLTRCVGIAKGDPDYRMPRRDDFSVDVTAAFGKPIADLCWLDKPVAISREIRHAIVHNGGRMTRGLKKLAPDLPLEGGEIVILATDTTTLYHGLKDRTYRLVETAVSSN